ncbi:hypothetical protein PA25_11640 [Pseudoalteromonas sp. A25]|uniref:hypothetical protein n=1 Tax=Pseudoalteromonas sp. A25 TaxID=116092 RepID=UPI001260CA4F|nr:hypothetical protein [Pseudoalteromonas sp. A25]BBN81179.1 hypothetical protein PA25_11640 [Pseudoalteromonas sp. A25]
MTLAVKVDLSSYQCPQLFVQFKWQLKQAQQRKVKKLHLYYLCEQDISDIVRYLEQHKFTYSRQQGSAPFLEVSIDHV